MQRRDFIGGLFGIGAAATALAATNKPETENGFVWETTCPLCKTNVKQFINLEDDAVTWKNQCSYCLAALDATGLSTKLREFQGRKWKGWHKA